VKAISHRTSGNCRELQMNLVNNSETWTDPQTSSKFAR
jgi:hypothetical protein